MPISYRKLNDRTYVGTIYLDAMLDEGYFREGVCHWQFTSTTAVLKATGAHAETGFSPYLMREQILPQQAVKQYFQKSSGRMLRKLKMRQSPGEVTVQG